MKYLPLKLKSGPKFVASSIFSSNFVRKYGAICIVLLLIVTVLYYQRVKSIQNYRIKLTSFQHTILLRQSSKSLELQLSTKDKWLPIGDEGKRFKIFSAYFDPRIEVIENFSFQKHHLPYGSVRVFCVLPLSIQKAKVFCNYKYEDNSLTKGPADDVAEIHEHFNLEFAAFSVLCPLYTHQDNTIVNLPDYVGLTYENEASMLGITSMVVIKYPKHDILQNSAPKKNISVCVPPAHNNYSNALRIVEFVEMYKILGVEKFYFYNKSISKDVDKVFKHYEDAGIADVLEWNLEGYEHEKDVRYEGIFAAINDCLYRSNFVDDFAYTLLIDFDEIFMPFSHETLTDFLVENDVKNVNSFNFQVVFFYKQYRGDNSSVPDSAQNRFLYTQVQTTRTKFPQEAHIRSKYIAKGRNIIEAGNHFVWRAVEDTHEFRVNPTDGMLLHYRDKCIGYNCDETVTDEKARLYEGLLWTMVDHECGLIFPEFNGKCPLK